MNRLGLLAKHLLDRQRGCVVLSHGASCRASDRERPPVSIDLKMAVVQRVPHPLLKIATQAARDVCKFGAEFGMTPCARAKMRAGWDPGGGGGPGKFDGLLA